MKVCPNCKIASRIIGKEVFLRKITVYDVYTNNDNIALIPYKSWWNEKEDEEEALESYFTCETCGYTYLTGTDEDILEEMDDA